MRGLLITGTDTGVGKTVVTSSIVRRLRRQGVRVGAYKPVASGSEFSDVSGDASHPDSATRHWPDVTALQAAVGMNVSLNDVCPQRFHAALAPPLAAALENRVVDDDLLLAGIHVWEQRADVVIVEGVGGLLCPLSDRWTIADFARELGFPVVLVASTRLGTINHTLLTIAQARAVGLRLAGFVINENEQPSPSGASSVALTTAESDAAVSELPAQGFCVDAESGELSPLHGEIVHAERARRELLPSFAGTCGLHRVSETDFEEYARHTVALEIARRSQLAFLGFFAYSPTRDLLNQPSFLRIDWLTLCQMRQSSR